MKREPKNISLIVWGVAIIVALAIVIGVMIYSNLSNNSSQSGYDETIYLAEDETNTETESASSSIGKSIEEEENAQNTVENNTTTSNSIANSTTTNTTSNTVTESTTNTTNTEATQDMSSVVDEEEITFAWPVQGEILKAFSNDTLLYSSTLDEWVVHNGIDIRADKASVVTAVADGVVKSIKNDPRYGLTVVIEHNNGYKSVYSNLLTAEFVVEGESVTQGQTLGTVGSTATFEIADDSHLHFELLKDSEYVDPTLYLQ